MVTEIAQELREMDPWGNAYHDQPLMDRCHEIAADAYLPISVRYYALRTLDRIMGMRTIRARTRDQMWREVTAYLSEYA